ncbi:hypothetical protein [Bradyrhizobium ganzhouense]|uniref:hypothetical protein n=1 Tax=Bradyrhizobium ganzhouense TaxID=1179767 RepID=UPI003CF0E152
MTINDHLIASPVLAAGTDWIRSIRAKAVASEAVQTLRAMAGDALFAYAMTGSAVASLAILVAPHLEMLLRCAAQGRG